MAALDKATKSVAFSYRFEVITMNIDRLTATCEEEYELINIVEELVRRRVRELIRKTDMCGCLKCELNACAIALNALAPRYVTTTRGALLAKIALVDNGYQTEVNIKVFQALKIVKDCPLHDLIIGSAHTRFGIDFYPGYTQTKIAARPHPWYDGCGFGILWNRFPTLLWRYMTAVHRKIKESEQT